MSFQNIEIQGRRSVRNYCDIELRYIVPVVMNAEQDTALKSLETRAHMMLLNGGPNNHLVVKMAKTRK